MSAKLPDWLTGAAGYDDDDADDAAGAAEAGSASGGPVGGGRVGECWQFDGVILEGQDKWVELTVSSLAPAPTEKVIHEGCFTCFKCEAKLGGSGKKQQASSSDGSFIEAGAQLYCVPCGRVARMASDLEEDARTEAEMKRLLAASAAQGKMNLDDVAALASSETAAAKEAELTARMGKKKTKKVSKKST
jgi:hypothetical protein